MTIQQLRVILDQFPETQEVAICIDRDGRKALSDFGFAEIHLVPATESVETMEEATRKILALCMSLADAVVMPRYSLPTPTQTH